MPRVENEEMDVSKMKKWKKLIKLVRPHYDPEDVGPRDLGSVDGIPK